MSNRKKHSASNSLECPPAKKRNLTKSTVDKWIADDDKVLSTSTWLKYDVDTAARGRVVAQCKNAVRLCILSRCSEAYVRLVQGSAVR